MIVIDVNLLIYAVNQDAPDHGRAKAWLESVVSGTETVGLPSIVPLSFLRLTRRTGLFQKPLTVHAPFDLGMPGCSSLPSQCPNLPRATCKRCVI